jgi:hypothetical protein
MLLSRRTSDRVATGFRALCLGTCFALATGLSFADTLGSVFVSGHDPDFHAQAGNTVGAQHIIQDALTFARNGNAAPILLIETNPAANEALGDHLDSEQGLINSGYSAGNTAGNHYVKVNATDFAAEDLSQFSAIFVPSDHGGSLTGDDLEALDNRSSDILNYINAGGGLVAFAEDGFHTATTDHSTPQLYGFLPFLVSSTAFSQAESGNTLTAEGVNLGLAVGDINGNFSHNIFTATGGMTTVDLDSSKEILSLDFRGQFTSGGVVVPEPGSLILLGTLFGGLMVTRFRRPPCKS